MPAHTALRIAAWLYAACSVTASIAAEGETSPAARPTQAKPLLVGNWADPTILRDGDDYYMTHSSFEHQPGLLVWHSRDLHTWRPICRAVVNQEGSIWAPDLIKHEGRYYIYYPAAGGNWVVTADSPHGPWSEPKSIGARHIDPGHVVGEDGKRYVHLSGGRAVEMSRDGLKATTAPKKVYDGWPIPEDWAIECFCLESPKLMERDGWYYVTSAQGGTAGPTTSHMVVSARSRGPLGPWQNSPHNPIIRTYSRDEPWWSKGHGTIVEGPAAEWYCVLHGWMNGHSTLGRCTLIEPIEWTDDGWFKASDRWPDGWDEPVRVEMPMSDDFDGPKLGIQWQFYRHYDPNRFTLADGRLTLTAQGADPGDSQPLCVMPLDRAYEIETEVEVTDGATAGLMLFSSPDVYIGLAISGDGVVRRVQEAFRRYRGTQERDVGRRRVALRIVNDKQDARFYYRDAAGKWRIMQPSMEISGARHNAIGGWHAVRPAVFACGGGEGRFSYFRYRPLEPRL
jgi:xylan 1,4-beta-xylosidase